MQLSELTGNIDQPNKPRANIVKLFGKTLISSGFGVILTSNITEFV